MKHATGSSEKHLVQSKFSLQAFGSDPAWREVKFRKLDVKCTQNFHACKGTSELDEPDLTLRLPVLFLWFLCLSLACFLTRLFLLAVSKKEINADWTNFWCIFIGKVWMCSKWKWPAPLERICSIWYLFFSKGNCCDFLVGGHLIFGGHVSLKIKILTKTNWIVECLFHTCFTKSFKPPTPHKKNTKKTSIQPPEKNAPHNVLTAARSPGSRGRWAPGTSTVEGCSGWSPRSFSCNLDRFKARMCWSQDWEKRWENGWSRWKLGSMVCKWVVPWVVPSQ